MAHPRRRRSPHLRHRVTLALHADRNVGWLQYDIDASRDSSAFTAPKLTSVLTRHLGSTTADSLGNFSEGLRVVRKESVGHSWMTSQQSRPDGDCVRHRFAVLDGSSGPSLRASFQRATRCCDILASRGRRHRRVQHAGANGYQVYPGSVHVFQPNLDTEDPLDARRHWWYSAAEVSDTSETGFWMRLHTRRCGPHCISRSRLHSRLSALN